MSIVAEQKSPEYYELRAIEEINAARFLRKNGIPNSEADYHQHMIKSIQLLLLARLSV